MPRSPSNTITKARVAGEDKERKEKMITWLKERGLLDAKTEKYLRSGKR
jgi:hypothetical protein